MAQNRIEKMLYSKRYSVTVLVMKDGSNYVLPMIRDPEVIARFCGKARAGTWGMTLQPEGMKQLLEAEDLQEQAMSF